MGPFPLRILYNSVILRTRLEILLAVSICPALAAVGTPLSPLLQICQRIMQFLKHCKIKPLLFGIVQLHSTLEDAITQDPGNNVLS